MAAFFWFNKLYANHTDRKRMVIRETVAKGTNQLKRIKSAIEIRRKAK